MALQSRMGAFLIILASNLPRIYILFNEVIMNSGVKVSGNLNVPFSSQQEIYVFNISLVSYFPTCIEFYDFNCAQ